MDRDPDGNPKENREVVFGHDLGGGELGGDVLGKEEKQLGVPLTPDRVRTRSGPTRWSGECADTFGKRRRPLTATATLSIVALAGAVAVGAVPFAAAGAIALLVPAAVIDIEQRRLPDVWLGAALLLLLAALGVGSVVGQPDDPVRTMIGAVGGALAMTLPLFALHLLSPASMGFGDVKAAAVLGAAVGTVDWRLGVVALCIAALSGALVGLIMRLRTVAFGPFLVFGAWCSLLGSDSFVNSIFAGGATP